MNMRASLILAAVVTVSFGCSGGPGGGTGGGSATGGGSGATGGGSGSTGGGSGGGSATGGGSGATGGGTAATGGGSGATGGGSGATGGGSGGPDYTCSGTSLPTTAAAMITLTGQTVERTVSTAPLAGVTLEVYTRAGTMIGSGMSDSSGNFSIMIPSGSTPVDGYIKATKTMYEETDFYPAVPWAADWSVKEIDLLKPSTVQLLALSAGVTLNMSDGQVFEEIVDCQLNPIAGATASSTPAAGQVIYTNGTAPDPMATSTDSQGAAVLVNMPPGMVTLSGMAGGHTLRDRGITSVAGVITQAEVQP